MRSRKLNLLYLQNQLSHIEQLATGSRWKRFFYQPVRYLSILLWSNLMYPISKKGKLRTTKTFFDAEMEVLLPAGMDLYLLGAKSHDSEIRLTRWLIENVKKGETFLDVGAHFGFFSLLAAHLVGEEGRVVSFEAASNTMKILRKNVQNSLNIHAVHRAVSDRKETLTFHEFPIQYSEYNTIHVEQFESENWFSPNLVQKVEIETVVLDEYLTTHHILPNCVKIDVEGAEEKVLEGLKKHLNSHPMILLVECTLLSIERHISMQQNLKKLHYFPFEILPDASLRAVSDIEQYLKEKKLESDNFVFKKL